MEHSHLEKESTEPKHRILEENFKISSELQLDDPYEYEKERIEIIHRANDVIQVTTEPELIDERLDENGFSLTELTGYRPVRNIDFLSEGKVFSFLSLLPSNVRIFEKQGIMLGARAFFNPEEQKIIYSREKSRRNQEQGTESFFKPEGALFDLLHEIGHSHSITPEKWNALLSANIDSEDRLSEASAELILQEERNAHAYALRELKKLRRQGIDLEPNLRTFGDLHRYIHGILAIEQKHRRIQTNKRQMK